MMMMCSNFLFNKRLYKTKFCFIFYLLSNLKGRTHPTLKTKNLLPNFKYANMKASSDQSGK